MLETERLIFRRFTEDDLPLLVEQRSDPEVNKYLGGPARQNADALSTRLKFYMECYNRVGFGMCAMLWRDTGEMIGSAGLQPLEDTGDIEVGYSLIRDFWGKGLGTEAAKGWMTHGFDKHGLDRIVAVAVKENAGSRRIMEKLGMRFEKNEIHYGEECAFYGISREEFFRHNTI